MRFIRLKIFVLIFAGVFSALGYFYASSCSPDAIVGYWLTENSKAKIQIYKSGTKYFGKIVWLKNPTDDTGKPKTDRNNPKPQERSKPLVGLLLLRNFEFVGNSSWENGNIYDPESGKDYSCNITLINANTVDVRGYIGFSLLGRTQTWTRSK